MTKYIDSPNAAQELEQAVEDGLSMFDYNAETIMGETDCPDGCAVESDGYCSHGYLSAARTLGVI